MKNKYAMIDNSRLPAKGFIKNQLVIRDAALAEKKVNELSRIVAAMDDETEYSVPGGHENKNKKKSVFSMVLPKVSSLFASRAWLLASGMILLNMAFQGHDSKNDRVVEEFKVTTLNPDQMSQSAFVAVAQEVSFNNVTKERDTMYYAITNPDRLHQSMVSHGKDYSGVGNAMHSFNTSMRDMTGVHSKTLEETATYYNNVPSDEGKRLPDPLEDKVVVKQYQPMGIAEDGLKAAKNTYGKGFKKAAILPQWDQGDLDEMGAGFRFIYKVAETVFPTGKAIISSQPWEGTSMVMTSYHAKNTGDQASGYDKTSDGVIYSWEDKVAEFTSNGTSIGTVKVDKDYYQTATAGHKLPVLK